MPTYLIVVFVLVNTALIGCGESGPAELTRSVATDLSSSSTASHNTPLFAPDKALYTAPMVLVGKVADVGGPFWNEDDGQNWDADDGGKPAALVRDYALPILYREVTLEVSEVFRDEIELTPYERDYLQTISGSSVQAVKSASNDGPKPGETLTFVTSSGVDVGPLFSVGERVAVLLQLTVLPLRNEPVIVYWTFHGPNGTYHLVEKEGAEVVVLDADFWTSSTDPNSGEEIVVTTSPGIEALKAAPSLDDLERQVTEIRQNQNPEWDLDRLKPGWAEFQLASILGLIEDYKSTNTGD